MNKQHQLSPEKYIVTKARSLPIDKCYLTLNWEDSKMASIFVMRRHVNGNLTTGIFLVDLMCLGVKDTFYLFNMPKEAVEARLNMDKLPIEEAEYNLVHNIIYAGHDFAMEFDIKPHKSFSITKFILEEDDDSVPLIEIEVGDEDGKPSLMVDSSFNSGPILQKLKQHAGEGNYTLYLDDGSAEDEDDFDEDDFDDEDDEDDDTFLDFDVVRDMETDELGEIIGGKLRTYSDRTIVSTELLLRRLDETEGGILKDLEELKKGRDYQLYDRKKEQWKNAHEKSKGELHNIFPQLKSLGNNEDDLDDKALMASFIGLLEKYKSDDAISYMIVSSIPMLTLLKNIGLLETNFQQYTPAVQLFLTSYAALRHLCNDAVHGFIINASNVEMAYPFNRSIHGMHHKLFWLIKAVDAIRRNDKQEMLHYHNLLRISGTGGDIKFLYAAQLNNWLKKYMGLETDEDEYVDIMSL